MSNKILNSWAVLRNKETQIVNFTRILKVSSKKGRSIVKIMTSVLSDEFDKSKDTYFSDEIEYFSDKKLCRLMKLRELNNVFN